MRIGYFADGPWAHRAFQKMVKDNTIEIKFICVRYDRNDEVLKQYADLYGIDLLMHSDINSEDFWISVKEYNVDMFVSMSFNQIFKERLLNLPPLKTINCHAGKLPFYRGRNILNWALINDEKEFGITVHYLDTGIDTGDIILQKCYPITDEDTYGTLLERAYEGCAETLYQAIKLIQAGNPPRIKQDTIDKVGFYCGMRKDGDEIIDWGQSSRRIFNFVRAISFPGPGARTFAGNEEVIINKVKLIEGAREYIGIPGQIIGKKDSNLLVKTGDSFVEVCQYECGKKLKMGDRLGRRYE